jgi:hypothetical protein
MSALLAGGLALAASAASAQYTAVATQTAQYSQQVIQGGSQTFYGSGGGPVSPTNLNALSNVNGNVTVSNYQVATTTTSNYIDFADNATSTGYETNVSTSTNVQVNFQNTSPDTIDAKLNSTVSPAGFGFYIGDLSKNSTTSGSGNALAVSDINRTPESTTATYPGSGPLSSQSVGLVTVNFTISTCADVAVWDRHLGGPLLHLFSQPQSGVDEFRA